MNNDTDSIRDTMRKCLRRARAGHQTIEIDGAQMSVRAFAASQIARHLSWLARSLYSGDSSIASRARELLLKRRASSLAEQMVKIERALRRAEARG